VCARKSARRVIRVIALPGPSSVAGGIGGGGACPPIGFYFEGFLPSQGDPRARARLTETCAGNRRHAGDVSNPETAYRTRWPISPAIMGRARRCDSAGEMDENAMKRSGRLPPVCSELARGRPTPAGDARPNSWLVIGPAPRRARRSWPGGMSWTICCAHRSQRDSVKDAGFAHGRSNWSGRPAPRDLPPARLNSTRKLDKEGPASEAGGGGPERWQKTDDGPNPLQRRVENQPRPRAARRGRFRNRALRREARRPPAFPDGKGLSHPRQTFSHALMARSTSWRAPAQSAGPLSRSKARAKPGMRAALCG